MRLAFVVSTILLTSATFVFLACSSDDADPPGTGTAQDGGSGEGTTSSSGSGTSGFPAPSDASTDAVVRSKVTGCLLFTTGLKSAAKIENVPQADTVNWTNAEGALKEDDKAASVVLNDGQQSAVLRVSDFNLNVPQTADTYGIVVEIKRRAQPDTGVLQTSNINVQIPGKASQFKFDNEKFFWPRQIVGTHEYGQAVDTWNVDLFPADVNVPAFGAVLQVKKAPDGGAGPITGTVDAFRVGVWYATADKDHCAK